MQPDSRNDSNRPSALSRLANRPRVERNCGASRDVEPYGVESALDLEQEALCRMLARIVRRLRAGNETRRNLRIVK